MEDWTMTKNTRTKGDTLRTAASLVGVSTGIFITILSFAVIDALGSSIQSGFDHFGSNLVMIDRFPTSFEEGDDWARFASRPAVSIEDFTFLKNNSSVAESVAFTAKGKAQVSVVGKRSLHTSSARDAVTCNITGVAGQWNQLCLSPLASGRFLSSQGSSLETGKAMIGQELSDKLFGKGCNPVGLSVKAGSVPLQIVGCFADEGNNIISLIPTANTLLVDAVSAQTIVGKGNLETMIIARPRSEFGKEALADEFTGLLRRFRRLPQSAENNFAVNTLESLAAQTLSIIGKIKVIGGIIGLFSLLIGAFGIITVLRLSVKERTPQIGLKKALGAKRWRIVWEFMKEALQLSACGSLMGIFMAWVVTLAVPVGVLDISLKLEQILTAAGIATALGLAAGTLPSVQASRLNPVECLGYV
ncbi:MAG: ABC transporter permease [Bacteroidales bacterium]|nr:ABC transporter permease [Bacteroidales bacterium]